MPNKTIEQLENDIWPEPDSDSSGLILRCHKYRKTPIDQLAVDEICTLLNQRIGVKFLIPTVINLLSTDILMEGLYRGQLCESSLKIDRNTWNSQPQYFDSFLKLVDENRQQIVEELGDRISYKINALT